MNIKLKLAQATINIAFIYGIFAFIIRLSTMPALQLTTLKLIAFLLKIIIGFTSIFALGFILTQFENPYCTKYTIGFISIAWLTNFILGEGFISAGLFIVAGVYALIHLRKIKSLTENESQIT